MSVTLVKGGTTVVLQNPVLGNEIATRKAQVFSRDAGGGRYAYDQGPAWKTMILRWEHLRESEKTALQSFFEDDADGMRLSFTYTDHEGDSWTAYFNQPALEFTVVGDQTASTTTFSSGGVSYPTTVREKAVYAVDVELEVAAA